MHYTYNIIENQKWPIINKIQNILLVGIVNMTRILENGENKHVIRTTDCL